MINNLIYKDKFGQEWTLSKEDNAFNEAAEAYIKKFSGSIPRGIGMPEITTELLIKAVAEGKRIKELPIPKGAVS